MGFDLMIASGDDNALLGEGPMGSLVEARIEQSLGKPTKFAIKFLDDIEDGKPRSERLRELGVGAIVTIAAKVDDDYVGLVRGPILDAEARATIGGPGGSFLVKGLDRRDLLARDHRDQAWEGRASDIVVRLLGAQFPAIDAATTLEVYKENDAPLPQRGTDLDLATKVAKDNGFHFWISYAVGAAAGGKLKVEETAHWKESPELPGDANSFLGGAAAALAEKAAAVVRLVPDQGSKALRVHVGKDACYSNVTSFELRRDGARPTIVNTAALNTADNTQDPITVAADAAPMGGDGARARETLPPRAFVPAPQGDPQTSRIVHRAALREAAFYVKASVSTTRHLLKRVLLPHQVVSIEGIGGANAATPFRVDEVVHVINGQAHFMDAKLSTNAEVRDEGDGRDLRP